MPITAPTCRAAEVTAAALANCRAPTSCAAAAPSVGKAKPMPMPVMSCPGSQSVT